MRAAALCLSLLLSACGNEGSAQSDDSEPISSSGPSTPRELLTEMRTRVAAGEIDRVRELVLPYRLPDGQSAPDVVVAALREGDTRGDWAFSLPALDALIARADDFGAPDPRMARRWGDLDPRMRDPASLRVFVGAPESLAHMVIAVVDGRAWLVFWESLTSLAPDSAN